MENIEEMDSRKDSCCSEGNDSCCTKCPEAKETSATTDAEESEFKVHDCDICCEGCQ